MFVAGKKYETVAIQEHGSEHALTVHICVGNRIEFFTPGGVPVTLDQDQFAGMIAWVEKQLETLGRVVVH